MIVAATPAHAAVMAAIHAQSFPPGETWDAATVATQLSLPGSFGLVAGMGGMLLARVVAGEGEILTLAVAPRARRMGLAREMLRAAMAQAAGAGAITMFLEVARANQPARALYGESGFFEVGRRRGYYADGGDALVLRAELHCGAPPPANPTR
jgi:ribosomal-protein-alanine N-acetyltransferase